MKPNLDLWKLAGLTLLAFGLRAYHLDSPPLLWDEGWSIGLSRLPLPEIVRITALDVHPPLYYGLLKVWLGLGSHEFVTRFLSVIAGTLTIPLGYHAGRAWRHRRVGTLAALYLTIAPPLIYYSQITRMYAWCAMWLVLGAYGLLRYLHDTTPSRRSLLIFSVGAAGALYSFYYAGFVLAALLVYALLAAPRRWKSIGVAFAGVAGFFLPWVVYAVPPLLQRVGTRTGFDFDLGSALRLAVGGFYGLVFPYGVGWPAVWTVLGVGVLGLLFGLNRLGRWALLPVLVIGATLFGAALGAQAHMFAARYTLVASPFLALGIAGALALLIPAQQAGPPLFRDARNAPRWLFGMSLLVLLATTVPTIARYVYTKSYEIFDPFDPSSDWQVLHGPAAASDIVFFNVLSLAGTYDRYRTPDDPPWSYALRWDPVIEPMERIQARVEAAAQTRARLWFVLYKGTVGANADLKTWLDQRFFPAAAPGWQGDTLYLAYVEPEPPWESVALNVSFSGGIVLQRAEFTPQARGAVGVVLYWKTEQTGAPAAKVFVHLYDAAGQLVAQHDSFPAYDTRPPSTWQPGEEIIDRHGLAVPAESTGPWRLVAGLYDPATGERLSTATGEDAVEIGSVTRPSLSRQ